MSDVSSSRNRRRVSALRGQAYALALSGKYQDHVQIEQVFVEAGHIGVHEALVGSERMLDWACQTGGVGTRGEGVSGMFVDLDDAHSPHKTEAP